MAALRTFIEPRGFEIPNEYKVTERLNGTIREREKVMRGLKNNNEVLMNGFTDYYNFVKPHMSLRMTPAEASKINLNLSGNRWLKLIELSLGEKNE